MFKPEWSRQASAFFHKDKELTTRHTSSQFCVKEKVSNYFHEIKSWITMAKLEWNSSQMWSQSVN